MGRDGDSETALRLQVSLRLKAARYLAGGLSQNGKRAVPLSVSDLAEREILRENDIRKNRLEEYEQMDVTPRPMELEKIALALDVAPSFLLEPLAKGDDETRGGLQAELVRIRQELGELVRDRRDMKRRLRHLSPEEADEMVRLLAEARMRQGRDISRRALPAARAKDRRATDGTGGA